MLSRAEFASLDRYSNGRLLDLPNVFHLLTDELVEELHSDDWSYYQELFDQLEYEYAHELNYERQFVIG